MTALQSINKLFGDWLIAEATTRGWRRAASDLAERNALLERLITEQMADNDTLQREVAHKDRCILALNATVQELQVAVLHSAIQNSEAA